MGLRKMLFSIINTQHPINKFNITNTAPIKEDEDEHKERNMNNIFIFMKDSVSKKNRHKSD